MWSWGFLLARIAAPGGLRSSVVLVRVYAIYNAFVAAIVNVYDFTNSVCLGLRFAACAANVADVIIHCCISGVQREIKTSHCFSPCRDTMPPGGANGVSRRIRVLPRSGSPGRWIPGRRRCRRIRPRPSWNHLPRRPGSGRTASRRFPRRCGRCGCRNLQKSFPGLRWY